MQTLKTTKGPFEVKIATGYKADRELYLGIPLGSWDEATAYVKGMRGPFLDGVIANLRERVICSGDLNNACIKMFNFHEIPTGHTPEESAARAEHGVKEVEYFVRRYAHMWKDGRGINKILPAVLAEWAHIKSRFAGSKSWQLKTNNDIRVVIYVGLRAEFPETVEGSHRHRCWYSSRQLGH